jgi:hypothetical protein
MRAKRGTPEGDRLDVLVTLVGGMGTPALAASSHAQERRAWPIDVCQLPS